MNDKSLKEKYMEGNRRNPFVLHNGIEIVDGKLNDNWVSPVVISGYVPDLLKSITMISDDLEVEGSGFCGKGYKEWVRVSDGGPALKVKV